MSICGKPYPMIAGGIDPTEYRRQLREGAHRGLYVLGHPFRRLSRWTPLINDRVCVGRLAPRCSAPCTAPRATASPSRWSTRSCCTARRSATRAAASWPKHVSLAVNLSPSQLLDQATARQIFSILDETGFDPRRLEVEITETGLMGDPGSAAKLIDELRNAGIRIALDDFGTGQSSLGRLREFQFDKLKIDRAFVSAIIEDRVADHIVQAILAMGDGLGLDVVAEGIEHEAQAARLLAHGCPKGQGYLFGRPADAARTASLIARQGAPALYPALP